MQRSYICIYFSPRVRTFFRWVEPNSWNGRLPTGNETVFATQFRRFMRTFCEFPPTRRVSRVHPGLRRVYVCVKEGILGWREVGAETRSWRLFHDIGQVSAILAILVVVTRNYLLARALPEFIFVCFRIVSGIFVDAPVNLSPALSPSVCCLPGEVAV